MNLSNYSFVDIYSKISDIDNTAKTIMTIATVFGAVEFLVAVFSIPMTVFTSILVYNTSILHPNLKYILLAQFAYVFLFNGSRIGVLSVQFFVYHDLFWITNIITAITVCLVNYSHLLGHLLLLERILATIYVKTYETAGGAGIVIFAILAIVVSIYFTIIDIIYKIDYIYYYLKNFHSKYRIIFKKIKN